MDALRPAIVALIASAGLTILILAIFGEGGFKADIKEINFVSVLIFVSSLFVLRKWKVNPVFVMLGAGIIGGAIYMFC